MLYSINVIFISYLRVIVDIHCQQIYISDYSRQVFIAGI